MGERQEPAAEDGDEEDEDQPLLSGEQQQQKQRSGSGSGGGSSSSSSSSSSGGGGGGDGVAGSALLQLLGVKRYPLVLLAGLIFDFARIGMDFIGPWFVNDSTHSPRLVQLTGTATWSFLILGPCFGLLSDRFDRRRMVIVILFVETGLSVVVGLLLMTGQMTPSLMLLYMVCSSVCKVRKRIFCAI
jgi:hypothetical protein